MGDVNKLFFQKFVCMPSNVLPLHLKQTFPLTILIFTEGEGDGIESRLPFRIFFILIGILSLKDSIAQLEIIRFFN